jgi:hypothetical protein
MGIFLAWFAYMWFSVSRGSGTGTGEPPFFKYIFPLHCLTMLLMFALMGIYVFHAYRTDRIPQDKKVLWVVILFFGNLIAFPIYWYLYMWRAAPPADTPPIASSTSAG